MARDTQSKTTRARVADPRVSDVRIDEHTRYINARGNRNATGTADALRSAFGAGSQFVNDRTIRLNEEGEALATQDAALGKDQDEVNRNAGYMRGWSKLQADNDFIHASAEFQEHMRGADFENMDEADVSKEYDTFMQDRFKGAESDPEYAAQLAPQLLKLEQATLIAHKDLVLQATQAKQGAMLVENMKTIQETTGEFNHEYLAAETGRIWDGAMKNEQYMNIMADAALAAGDPSIIEDMPETYPSGQPTPKNRPEYQKVIESATKAARVEQFARSKAAEDAFKSKYQTERAVEHAYGTQLAKSADPRTIEFVINGGEDGPNGEPRLLTRSQQKSLLDTYYTELATNNINESLGDQWAGGNGISFNQTEVDAAATDFVNDPAIQEALAELPPEKREVAMKKLVVERSVVNGPAPLPSVIKDGMEVNVNNPEKFKEALELYRYTEAQLPGYAKTQISDESARTLASFERLVEDFGSEERAMEAISQIDYKRVDENKKAISDAADELASDLNNKPWSLSSYNDPTITRAANKEIAHYVALGYDIEQAVTAADRHIRSRYIVVNDRYWSANSGWGINAEAASTWMMRNEAVHQGVDPDQISVRPHPQQEGVAIISNVGAALPGYTMKVSEIAEAYERSEFDLSVISAELAEKDANGYNEAVRRAKAEYVPMSPFMDSSMRAEHPARREAMWKNLTETERQRLTLQQIE